MEKLEHIKLNSISKDTIDYIVYINNKMFKNFLKINIRLHTSESPTLIISQDSLYTKYGTF